MSNVPARGPYKAEYVRKRGHELSGHGVVGPGIGTLYSSEWDRKDAEREAENLNKVWELGAASMLAPQKTSDELTRAQKELNEAVRLWFLNRGDGVVRDRTSKRLYENYIAYEKASKQFQREIGCDVEEDADREMLGDDAGFLEDVGCK